MDLLAPHTLILAFIFINYSKDLLFECGSKGIYRCAKWRVP